MALVLVLILLMLRCDEAKRLVHFLQDVKVLIYLLNLVLFQMARPFVFLVIGPAVTTMTTARGRVRPNKILVTVETLAAHAVFNSWTSDVFVNSTCAPKSGCLLRMVCFFAARS